MSFCYDAFDMDTSTTYNYIQAVVISGYDISELKGDNVIEVQMYQRKTANRSLCCDHRLGKSNWRISSIIEPCKKSYSHMATTSRRHFSHIVSIYTQCCLSHTFIYHVFLIIQYTYRCSLDNIMQNIDYQCNSSSSADNSVLHQEVLLGGKYSVL